MIFEELVFNIFMDMSYFLIIIYFVLLLFALTYVISVTVLEDNYKLLLLLAIPLLIILAPLFLSRNTKLYYNNSIDKLNKLEVKGVDTISFYKVKYCDLSETKEELITIKDKYKLKVFLNDYFKDLKIDVQETWDTKDGENRKFLEKYFDKSVLEDEKQWGMLLMMEIKKKNNETLHICVNYAEILYKSPSKIVFPVDFGKEEKYKSIAVSYKLKKFLKTLKLSKEL